MRILFRRMSVRYAAWRTTLGPGNFVATWAPIAILSVALFALVRSVTA